MYRSKDSSYTLQYLVQIINQEGNNADGHLCLLFIAAWD